MSVELNAPMIALSPYRLDHIHPPDRLWVGDKALQLADALQNGFPVVPGLAIPSTALHSCLQYTAWPYPLLADLADSALHLDRQNPRQLQAVAAHLREMIEHAPLTAESLVDVVEICQAWEAPALIIRPSLAIDWEGEPPRLQGLFDARVCLCEPVAIAQALKHIWSQLFRARSLVFWNRFRIPLQKVYAGILVQPLHDAIVSGEMLIQDSQVQICATLGLGLAIARGDVVPDDYTLDLHTYPDYTERLHLKRYRLCLRQSGSESGSMHGEPGQAVHPVFSPIERLQHVEVEALQQAQPALSRDHLDALVDLARRYQTVFSASVRIGWTVPLSPPSAAAHPAGPQVVRLEQLPSSRPYSQSHPKAVQGSFQTLDELEGVAAAPGHAIATAWVAPSSSAHAQDNMPQGAILVASSLQPEWLPWLQCAAAIVTEQGGMTSHGAILARELGIPAVVGVAQATQIIKTGDQIFVDGDRGRVQQLPINSGGLAMPYPKLLQALELPIEPAFSASRSEVAAFPSRATQLFINWSQREQVADAAALPVDGLGLLRSEFLLHDRLAAYSRSDINRLGAIAEIAERIQTIAAAFFPRPVFYRSLDLRSPALTQERDRSLERNAILGLHGTLSYQHDPALFDLEMGAIAQLHQAGLTNIRILLPFVRTVEEFTFCRHRLTQHPFPQPEHVEIWLMAEVPSVLFLLPEFAQAGVSGICIGSNDLTQLILGVDRDQAEMAIAYDPLHPAVLAAMRHLIQTAKTLDLPCSICGQAPSQYPQLIEQLIGWGITAISVTPDAVSTSLAAIAQAEARFFSASKRDL